MAGYTKTPLIKKLGYRQGESVYALFVPEWFKKELESEGIDTVNKPPAIHAHAFFENSAALKDYLKTTDLKKIEKSLWVSWPKKSSGVQTDVVEQTFRNLILPLGWVDVKVAAIDDAWSGLKFVRRKA